MSSILLALALHRATAAPPAPTVAVNAPAGAPGESNALPPHTRHATAADALTKVLASNPRILGVGELHAKQGAPVAPTTLARFTTELLPVLAPHTTDLVIETWRLDGRCGPQEEVVAEQVQEDTKRPEATKSELVLLVEAAVAAGVRPHDLAITCAEYERLQTPDGIDYAFLLGVLTDRLGEFAKMAAETPDATMVLYGGAVHNDIAPSPALARYAYGKDAAPRGGYVELDLYDPALLAATPSLIEPAWAPLLSQAGPDHVLLYERGPDSFVLLLPAARPAPSP
jgi:hypothetical protein